MKLAMQALIESLDSSMQIFRKTEFTLRALFGDWTSIVCFAVLPSLLDVYQSHFFTKFTTMFLEDPVDGATGEFVYFSSDGTLVRSDDPENPKRREEVENSNIFVSMSVTNRIWAIWEKLSLKDHLFLFVSQICSNGMTYVRRVMGQTDEAVHTENAVDDSVHRAH